MPISISCQECGKSLRVKVELAGRRVKCANCEAVLTIPHPDEAETDAPFSGGTSTNPPADDQRFSLDEFVSKSRQQDRGQGIFELESPRMLEVNLNGSLMTKTGSMIAYVGEIKFTREGLLDKGIGKLLKKAVTGEGTRLTKAEGSGRLYLADTGKKIQILHLENEAIYVNGNDLLALENSIEWDIKMMKKITAMMAGGLFNVRLEGTGLIAITTHYEPLTLMVTPDQPVITDPNATIAWSGDLTPEFRTDISLKTFFGRGSGESIQMQFQGNGFVVIQPFEEVVFQQTT